MPTSLPFKRVLTVLGGQQLPPKLLRSWAESAEIVLAADAGADALLAVGCTPDIVIGDLDSLASDKALFPDVRHDPDQESTDCDKLLALAEGLNVTSITVLGAEGDLPDHVLANLLSLAKSSVTVRVVYRRGIGMILKGETTVIAKALKRVSVIPITECRVSMTGVRWILVAEKLSPLGRNSVSNETTSGQVTVTVHSGAAFLFIETPPKPWWTE